MLESITGINVKICSNLERKPHTANIGNNIAAENDWLPMLQTFFLFSINSLYYNLLYPCYHPYLWLILRSNECYLPLKGGEKHFPFYLFLCKAKTKKIPSSWIWILNLRNILHQRIKAISDLILTQRSFLWRKCMI